MTQDERNALLKLADHVDVLVRFCAAHMPSERKGQYDAGANAFWSIVYRIAGDDDRANKMAAMVPSELVRPPNVTPEQKAALDAANGRGVY